MVLWYITELYMYFDCCLIGKYLAEITSQVCDDLEANKYVLGFRALTTKVGMTQHYSFKPIKSIRIIIRPFIR